MYYVDRVVKEIPLTKGAFAFVDDEDFVMLAKYRWQVTKNGYAHNHLGYMHRHLMQAAKGANVDHIDGNPLNNTRANLRFATHSQNMMNKHVAWGKSKYKGVIWNKADQTWFVRIMVDGERRFVGAFRDEVEAAKAYNNAALEAFKEYASLNTIDGYTNGEECATPAKIVWRRPKENCSSQYRGVTVDSDRQQFVAQITKGENKMSKRFTNEHAAAAWYNMQAKELYGVHAILNEFSNEAKQFANMSIDEINRFLPKANKASAHSNVFRNGKCWMVRVRKNKKTVLQKNFRTEDEAAEFAASLNLTDAHASSNVL